MPAAWHHFRFSSRGRRAASKVEKKKHKLARNVLRSLTRYCFFAPGFNARRSPRQVATHLAGLQVVSASSCRAENGCARAMNRYSGGPYPNTQRSFSAPTAAPARTCCESRTSLSLHSSSAIVIRISWNQGLSAKRPSPRFWFSLRFGYWPPRVKRYHEQFSTNSACRGQR